MAKFALTKKIVAEATEAMAEALDARAIATAAELALGSRVAVDRLGAEATAAWLARGVSADLAVSAALIIGDRAGLPSRSNFAYVHYGRGAQTERKQYSGRGAHWHDYQNPGIRWAVVSGALRLIGEGSDGAAALDVAAPRSLHGISDTGCTHGDLYSLTKRRGAVARYAVRDGRIVKIGVAVQYPRADAFSPSESGPLSGDYWEHGADAAECAAEYTRKSEQQRVMRAAARESGRDQRRLRLLARISAQVRVTRDDARAVGACAAGIAGWCERVGISDAVASMPAREIFALATKTGERTAIAAAIMAARRAVAV